MNDFTREELEALLVCVNGGVRSNVAKLKLPTKIQSMIDNYCEHKSAVTFIYPCSECGKDNEE